MKAHDVFTPGDYPEYTYVERGQGELETQLELQLRRPGAIISLSGPSKSGKSVLVERVVGSDDLVSVYGGQVESVDNLWNEVLDSLGAPQTRESVSGETERMQTSANAGIRAHIFSAGGSVTEDESSTEETIEIHERRGLDDVIKVNNKDSFKLLIDDFHYITPEIQSEVGEAIKHASEAGLKICVALIPHRSDDLTQANPDLDGRALTLELDYWNKDDLMKIGTKGFNALNIDFPQEAIETFAEESIGSPQLMQQLCYNACGVKKIEVKKNKRRVVKMKQREMRQILRMTGESLDLSTVFDILNGEGISKGKERKTHHFINKSQGDVYEAILRGIASDPIQSSLSRSKLIDKIEKQCANEPPRTHSITQALERMDERIRESYPESEYIEWDDQRLELEIPDPYLIFYLRWSKRLDYYPESGF